MICSKIGNKQTIFRQVSVQMLIVFAAFAVMAFTTYFFVSDIVRKNLLRDAEKAIDNTQAYIEADLMEPETTLDIIAETVREMILQGVPFDKVSEYITDITNYMLVDARFLSNVTCVYGVFDVFNGKYHSGIGWIPPDSFVPQDRPWYKAAISANGKVGITEPYVIMSLNEISITYARQILDEEGRQLGVVCLDVMLDRIGEYAVNTFFTETSYGILGDKDLKIIAHPHPSFMGRSLREMGDYEAIADILLRGETISEYGMTDYTGEKAVLFARQLRNGWTMAVMAHSKDYYKTVIKIEFIIGALGLIMSIILNIILMRITIAKNMADEKSRLMAVRQEEEIAANRAKSAFLAKVSHEIRTPMNAILGITEIHLQDDRLSPDMQESFEKIHNSGYLLLGIINDILDLSKIESGKFELVPVNYDVASLINDTIHLIIMRFDSKPIEFDLQLDENIPLTLFGDDLRIKQILNNLLSNAFKYTDSGKVSLSISAENKQALDRVTLEIRVSDTGHGMTQEQMDNMFTEYMRFNSAANRTTQGTGLGLSITQHLVQMMGGIICVESEPGKGSEFTVRLPQGFVNSCVLGKELTENLKRFRTSKTLQRKKSPQIVRKYMPYGRVLVVDDVETNLYVAKGLMTPYGLNIDTAGSGFEALKKIKNGAVYDIVFMDHFMPGMDGIETVKNMREMGYTRPIVALTANAISGQVKIFLENGFDDFISKPIDIRQLNAVLNKLIRDKQPPEVISAAGKQADELQEAGPQSINPHLAEVFARDAEKVTAALKAIHEKNVYTDEDVRTYIINIHGIKSALANIGETELSNFALKLEVAGREGDTGVLSDETSAFLEKLHATVEKIKPKEDGANTAGDSNDDMAYLHEKLVEIQTACTAYDIKTAEEALGELQKKTWSGSVNKRLNAISEDLMHSEFEEAGYLAGCDSV